MALPKITINLANGRLGRVAQTDDGIAGLILTGAAVEGKLELNKVYQLSSTRDLVKFGITAENNPLAYKDVTKFYMKAGDGAELYLLIVSKATTLTQMSSMDAGSPIHKLIDFANGRIRLVGLNRIPDEGYEANTAETGIDRDAITAGEAMQAVALSYAKDIDPFRVLMPGLLWDGTTENLFKPREATYNRVGYVLASDQMIGETASASIGEALGMLSAIPVHHNLGRVKNGQAAAFGQLTDGTKPEDHAAILDTLHDAGYIIYRQYKRRNGYYYNDDTTAAPLTDDYSNLTNGRVIDKAIILAYNAYIDEILDSVVVDDDGYLPQAVCTYYERLISNAVAIAMSSEISGFRTYIDPKQNILSSSLMNIVCNIRPVGYLRDIVINLGFENPARHQYGNETPQA
jgi:hypothetical protein